MIPDEAALDDSRVRLRVIDETLPKLFVSFVALWFNVGGTTSEHQP